MRVHIVLASTVCLLLTSSAALVAQRGSGVAADDPPAEQAYKNIRVLKGVTRSQFMNTMFFQRYALGVSCTYCHVDGQWEKDDKPAKQKARQMIQMVLDLNRNTFKGDNAVNCVTCHRGSPKVQTEIEGKRLTFDEMLAPRHRTESVVEQSRTRLPSIDEVFAKYIASLGGQERLGGIKHTVTTGTLITAEGLAVPYDESFAAPNKWVSVTHFGADLGDWSRGFDGKTAWNKDNRGVNEQVGQARGRFEMTLAFQTPLRIRDLYSDLKVLGEELTGATSTIVLEGRATPTGLRERLYFESSSGLLRRRSTINEGAYGNYLTDIYYDEYRSIDGIMTPLVTSEFTPDFGTVRKLRTVDHDAVPNPGIFAKPEK